MAGTQISLLCFGGLEQLMLGAATQWIIIIILIFEIDGQPTEILTTCLFIFFYKSHLIIS